ncbi:aminodeoxychorismate synthase component I [bacterium]|nr:MAG: aminodeoxychorismate synthase component I [bacterium]
MILTPMILTRTIDLDLPLWRVTPRLGRGNVFLLDSALDPQRLGRWSFAGCHPPALLTAKRRHGAETGAAGRPFLITLTTWRHPDGELPDTPQVETWTGDPFVALRSLQVAYDVEGHEGDDPAGPFSGGLVGWFGYELAHALENLPDTGRDDLDLPDLAFMVVDEVLAHDHVTGDTTLSITDRGDAAERFAWWQTRLATPDPGPVPAPEPGQLMVGTSCDRETYGALVTDCVEHILAGDVFEVCLTHRLETALRGEPWRLYEILRQINPAPFAVWLDLPGCQVVSASPERFLSLTADGQAESRPIKGTAPRGANLADDAQRAADLAASAKDRAENVMIVDLVRNDLGRACEVGSVTVPEICTVESYATVHQLVSTVRGQLRPDRDALDLVAACFPGGSMTGAPKIAAIALADRLEPFKRGIYSGAVGYLDRGGAMDLSIVIRSIVCADGRATLGVGGAVTADSDPGAEYDESLDKARALLDALARLEN